MSTGELIWLSVGFTALSIAVLTIGLVLLMRSSQKKLWTGYACLVGAAVIAWGALAASRSGLDVSEGGVSFTFAYYFWVTLSLGVIVCGGSFWFLVGRTAALERELPPNHFERP
jgi:hypothetical protein